MEDHHLNQPELASQLGVSQSTVSLWLSGKTQPGLDKLITLADIFHYDRAALLRQLGFIDSPFALTPELESKMKQLDEILRSSDNPKLTEYIDTRLIKAITAILDDAEYVAELMGSPKEE